MNRPHLRDPREPSWLTAGAVVVLASGLVAVGDSPAIGVSQATVLRGTVTATASASGTVESADTRDLVFGTSGTVTKVEVAPGDAVRSGQVLARLDDTAAKGQVEAAKAAVAAADDTYAKAQEGICTGAGGRSGSSGGSSGSDGSGGSGAGGSAGLTPATAAGHRERPVPGHGRPTPTPTPAPTPPSHQPTPAPTRSTPAPATPRPTHRPTSRPTGPLGDGRTGGHGRGATAGRGGGKACAANAVQLARAGVIEAEVKEREAGRTLDATKITAPRDGTVLAVSGTVGTQVTGQSRTAFLTLGDLSDLRVQAMFPLGEVDRLKLGQPASITLGMSAGHAYRGSVTQIAPAATTDGTRALFAVMISLDERPPAGLRTGMSATAEVTTAKAEDTLYVPASAVHTGRDGAETVLVRHDGRTTVHAIRTGLRGDRYVAVTGGLTAGDRIVMPTTGQDGYPAPAFPGA